MGTEHVKTIFDCMSESGCKLWAKEFIRVEKHHLHTINDIIVFKYLNKVGIINKVSLFFKFFYTENDAVDYVLSHYKASNNGKQGELWN